MKLAYLTASTAALLLSSTSLMAQEATSGGAMGGMDFTQSVFVDVDGAAYQIPIDLAAELCGSDAATLTQTAQSAFDASGMDPAMMAGGMDTAAAGTASGDAAATTGADTATADAGGTTGTDAGNAGAAGMGSDTQTADANATTGTDAAAGDVQNIETTAADTTTTGAAGGSQNFTAAGEEYLALVVCQVDASTASASGNTFAPATDAGATE